VRRWVGALFPSIVIPSKFNPLGVDHDTPNWNISVQRSLIRFLQCLPHPAQVTLIAAKQGPVVHARDCGMADGLRREFTRCVRSLFGRRRGVEQRAAGVRDVKDDLLGKPRR